MTHKPIYLHSIDYKTSFPQTLKEIKNSPYTRVAHIIHIAQSTLYTATFA